MELLKQPFMKEEVKLAEPWWDLGINPVFGHNIGPRANQRGTHNRNEEAKYYNTLPTLEITSK